MHGLYDFIVTPVKSRYSNTKKLGDKELILNTEIFTHKNVKIRRGSDGNIDTIMPPRYDLVHKDYEF